MHTVKKVSINRIKEVIDRTISLAERSTIAQKMQMQELRNQHNDDPLHMPSLAEIPDPPLEYYDLESYLNSLCDLELQILMHAMVEGRYIFEGYRTVCPIRDLQKESEPVYNHASAVEYVAGKAPLADYLRTYLRVEAEQAKTA